MHFWKRDNQHSMYHFRRKISQQLLLEKYYYEEIIFCLPLKEEKQTKMRNEAQTQ
jgi:hypothetical protein